MRRFFAMIFTIFLIAGCASNQIDYNRSSLDLEIGMSKMDVQGLMGPPRRTDVNEDRERWIFWSPVVIGFTPMDNEHLAQDRLVVTFRGGKVVRWTNQTLSDDMLEASERMLESSHKAVREQYGSTP